MTEETDIRPTCPQCGFSEADLRRTTSLGCPRCYETFEFQIWTMLPHLQAGEIHRGKVPRQRQVQPA